jgi:hypothetical protein
MCILFPIAYRHRAYIGVLSKEVETTIPEGVNQEHDKNPTQAGGGGINHRQIKMSNSKVGASGRHFVPPSLTPM